MFPAFSAVFGDYWKNRIRQIKRKVTCFNGKGWLDSCPERAGVSSQPGAGIMLRTACLYRLTICVAWLGAAAASAQDQNFLDQTSNTLASLPLRAVRADQVLKEARTRIEAGDIAGAQELSERALRLAAKELRDAYVDARTGAIAAALVFRERGPARVLDRLAAAAEQARRESKYDQVIQHYADAIRRLQEFQSLRKQDAYLTSALDHLADWLTRNCPEADRAVRRYQKDAWQAYREGRLSDAESIFRGTALALSHYARACTNLQAVKGNLTPEIIRRSANLTNRDISNCSRYPRKSASC